ncbi:MAG: flagellar basal body-associated FliL family protein [Betaproteobacteria bacterium]|nr:flagellar basal body-associated FliL family protein [Betaproteobacteria bacterium]
MANEKTPPAQAPATTPNKGKRAVIILLAAVILLLLVAIVGGGLYMLKSSQDDSDDDEDAIAEVKTQSKKKLSYDAPPIFVKLDKFTVNLRPAEDGSGADSYMQADITLQVDTLDADAHLKNLMPRIRNDITFIMSDKQAGFLMSKEGKEALAEEIRNAINHIVNPYRRSDGKPPESPIVAVLFESIIIQ